MRCTLLTQIETQLTQIETQSNNILPKGTIIMWKPPTGITSPPTGWAYCDGSIIGTGTNSIITPDLRGRFVLGANLKNASVTVDRQDQVKVDVGVINGREKLPTSVIDLAKSDHRHEDPATVTNGSNKNYILWSPVTDGPGQTQTISILPPYYALAYIMKIS